MFDTGMNVSQLCLLVVHDECVVFWGAAARHTFCWRVSMRVHVFRGLVCQTMRRP